MNIDNKFLLVCLQLIIVLLMPMSVEGKQDKCGDQNRALRVNKFLTSTTSSLSEDPVIAVARVYRLYNLRASADVSIKDKVTASARNSDRNGELGLETVMKDDKLRTRIRGICTEKYLCFNHRGRLVTKNQGRARGPKCEFEEEFENGHSRFKSALNSSWYVGFTREGRPLHGSVYLEHRCPNCFQFYKTESTSKGLHPEKYFKNNIDFPGHNVMVGQLPPGLSADFFREHMFPSAKENSPTTPPPPTMTTTTETPPPRFRHTHQHRANNKSRGKGQGTRNPKKSQRKTNRQHRNKATPSPTSLPPLPKFL